MRSAISKGALRIRRDASDTYYHLARAYQGLEEYDAAIEQLEIAIAFDPNYAQAHFLMGRSTRIMEDEVNASYHFGSRLTRARCRSAGRGAAAFGTSAERMARGEAALAERRRSRGARSRR